MTVYTFVGAKNPIEDGKIASIQAQTVAGAKVLLVRGASADLSDESYKYLSKKFKFTKGAGGTPDPIQINRGLWNDATAYAVGDVVSYLGVDYRRIVAGTTHADPATDGDNWLPAGGVVQGTTFSLADGDVVDIATTSELEVREGAAFQSMYPDSVTLINAYVKMAMDPVEAGSGVLIAFIYDSLSTSEPANTVYGSEWSEPGGGTAHANVQFVLQAGQYVVLTTMSYTGAVGAHSGTYSGIIFS